MTSIRRRSATVTVTFAALLLGLAPTATVHAADPAAAARDQLSRERGGAPNDFELVYERPVTPEATGQPMWAAKFLDRRTGEIVGVHQSESGELGSVAILDEAVRDARAALPALERKADVALVAAASDAAPSKQLPVAVWLDVDVTAAESAVRDAHPDVEWIAGRAIADSVERARALRGELWEARRAEYAAAAEAFRAAVEPLGAKMAYASTSAPLVFLDLPAGAVTAVAERAEVRSLGLEKEWRTSMSSAGPTVAGNWTSGSGDQGNGVRVAVVEYHNVQTTGDMSGQVVRQFSTTGRIVTGAHPTWAAGAVASRNATWRGVAPGADIVSASTGGYTPSLSTDRAIIAAADWAVSPAGGDADIVNASIGQDTATGAEEARRYFDSIGWEDGRLVVAASGNFTTFGNWNVVSPGTGYNVLTVGGVNDRNTTSVGDDRVWYVPGSNGAAYRDPAGTAWNPHGDFNKPNLSAPAVSVRTANGTIGDGTSVASPIVAGIAAQLVARAPSIASFPEATRAILMAGALRRTPMPGGGYNAGHEGVGTASALWSNRVLDNGSTWGGYTFGSMRRGQTIVRDIPVVEGQPVRVSLAWSSHTSGTSNIGKSDALTADLDLIVRQPNGTATGSFSWDNPYESVDVRASSTGTMRIEVRHDRFDAAEEPYGLAWALRSPYRDAETSAFYSDILWIAREGITVGCTADRFCPKGVVTRGQMATFLVRALDLPPTTRDYFDDDEGNIHEARINAIAAAGITVGCGSGRFCPDGTVLREQMATFMVRAFDLPPTTRDYYTDDNSSIHEDRINAFAAAGITRGCSAGPTHFCPRGSVTREQMAAFLHRALTR